MNRADVDELIRRCECAKAECASLPEVVREADAKLDVLHTLRDSVPERRSAGA